MFTVTTTMFRNNLSEYLDRVRDGETLYLGRRNKKEFIVLPADLFSDEDIEALQSKTLRNKIQNALQSKTLSHAELLTMFDINDG